ncbi:MAG: hypothetical protein KJ952_03600 [Candidatus Omnitrophica bacterium]|nr:hypothetical protein [Candidatus Omnitrophota bacterium]
MKPFLLFISIFWTAFGITSIIAPLKLKKLYTHLVKPAKGLFILPLTFGVLLLWASPASRFEAFIKVLGIIGLIKGLFILICPVNVLRSTFDWFLVRSERIWRVYGVIMLLLGIVTGWSVL